MNSYAYGGSVAHSTLSVRTEFIRKTYQHLAFAVLGFVGLEALLLNSPVAPAMARLMTGGFNWFIVLAVFMGVSWIADRWARSAISIQKQYMGLALYVFAQAIIFVPLLLLAKTLAPDVIPNAAILTGLLFAGLTYIGLTTKKDFSFLGGILRLGGFVALGFIALSLLFGFSLGLFFSLVMIVFAAGAILYDTSNIIHYYEPTQYVAASLSLFASVALLFWYVVQFLLAFTSSND